MMLRVLLPLQVFGGLLIKLGEDSEEETDSVAPKEGEKEGEVREHMADILLAKNKLSSLQKQVRREEGGGRKEEGGGGRGEGGGGTDGWTDETDGRQTVSQTV